MQTWMILFLWLMYLGLTANLEPSNLVVGLLIAVTLTALLHPDRLSVDLRQVPRSSLALLRYVVVVAVDVVQGGLQVARLVLDPKLPVRPGIIAIPSGSESQWATALSAHAITLSPGAMVVEIGEHGMMYTHTLDLEQADQSTAELQRLRRDLLEEILPE
ncbi:MAG TPA: Na+/H+ antiporter subunit E [Anaerolineae bacterium]|nr:Na+/H+ antiporter subunit E [Anaerolineae bacterium]